MPRTEVDQLTLDCAGTPLTYRVAITAFLMSVISLSGCSSGSTAVDDCRSASLACSAPFQCVVHPNGDDTSSYGCFSDQIGVPACTGTPSGQIVQFATVGAPNDLVQHWSVKSGDCVKVSYDPNMSSKKDLILGAVNAIRSIPGLSICFSDPAESPTRPSEPRRERRIHFRAGSQDSEPLGGQISVTRSLFEVTTGRLFAVENIFDDTQLQARGLGSLLHHLGNALGLASSTNVALATSITYSVITSDESNYATAPSQDDTIALTRLYGLSPYCAD